MFHAVVFCIFENIIKEQIHLNKHSIMLLDKCLIITSLREPCQNVSQSSIRMFLFIWEITS